MSTFQKRATSASGQKMDQKQRYNQIWNSMAVQNPKIWSTWEISKNFQGKRNLEIGPGNYPKIPLENGYFLDISETAIQGLKKLGLNTVVADATNLPFENEFFDFVAAMEVLEHIENHNQTLSEIFRVLKPLGFFMLSVPLKMEFFNEWDEAAGHYRRYEIPELQNLLSSNNFKIVKYRYPSQWLKKLNLDKSKLFKKAYQSEKSWNFFSIPKPLINLGVKAWAFFEKKGTPKWQTDVENLDNYKDKAIVMLCQKAGLS